MITINDAAYPHRADMTLLDALMEGAVDINGPVLITLNGTFVGRDAYRDTPVQDGAEILVMRVVSGG